MKKNFPLPLFLCFSIGIFLLWILGTWQLNKNFSISKNNERLKVNNKSNVSKVTIEDDIDDLTYVEFNEITQTNKYFFLEPRTLKGKVGFHKISIFKIQEKYLLVNQGFTSSKNLIKTNKNKDSKIIEGYIIRIPKPKFFELKNDIEKKIWYTLNVSDFENEFDIKLSPYMLYQQNFKKKHNYTPVMPNLVSRVNHLNYALTWYLLSLSLCIIFFIFFRKNYKNYE